MEDTCSAIGHSSSSRLDTALIPRKRASGNGQSWLSMRHVRRRIPMAPAAIEMEKSAAADGASASSLLSSPLDADIYSLLVPAIVAVFLDPAMALIDTGAPSRHWIAWSAARKAARASAYAARPERSGIALL